MPDFEREKLVREVVELRAEVRQLRRFLWTLILLASVLFAPEIFARLALYTRLANWSWPDWIGPVFGLGVACLMAALFVSARAAARSGQDPENPDPFS